MEDYKLEPVKILVKNWAEIVAYSLLQDVAWLLQNSKEQQYHSPKETLE